MIDKSSQSTSSGASTETTLDALLRLRLWRKVINQAVVDLISGTNREKEDTIEWIYHQDFSDVCELAVVDEDVVRGYIEGIAELQKHLTMRREMKAKFSSLQKYLHIDINRLDA